jgi:hypothetical protein
MKSAVPQDFWDLRYRRAAGVVHRDIGGEHLLVPVKGNLVDLRAIFSLNPIAADIWEKLDGQRQLGAIRAALLAEYEVEEDVLEADVREVLSQLAESGLIEVVP